MADLSDITAFFATTTAAAVYPSGTSSPSVANMDCRIYEGWPIPDQLDLDIAGKMLSGTPPMPIVRPGGPLVNVSIFPMLGTGIGVYQVQDETYTVVPPVFGMSVVQAGNTLTITGQPVVGEFLTLFCDNSFVYSLTGASTSALLAALATAAQTNYPSASSTSNTITVPTTRSLVVRQGSVATLGKVTHRQKHSIMVTVWAPTRIARNAVASAIDVILKENIRVTMPDTSQAIIRYSRTNVSDELQSATVYRRDLIYEVEYATLQQFPGYVVTSADVTIASANGAASATALT